jgi:DNA-binding transcriptional LysR family regulator
MNFTVHATPHLAEAHPNLFSPDTVWVGIHHDLANSPVFNWMSEIEDRNPIAARANSFVAARELAAAALGFAVLPRFLGDLVDRLVRLAPPPADLERSIWVLTPGNLGKSVRVRALSDHLVRSLKKQRAVLAGHITTTAYAP